MRLDFLLRYYKNDINKRQDRCRGNRQFLKKKLKRAAAIGLTGTIAAAAGASSHLTEAAAVSFPEQTAGHLAQASAAGQPDALAFYEPVCSGQTADHTEQAAGGLYEEKNQRQSAGSSWDEQVLLEKWDLDPEDFPGEEEEEEISVPDDLLVFFEAAV